MHILLCFRCAIALCLRLRVMLFTLTLSLRLIRARRIRPVYITSPVSTKARTNKLGNAFRTPLYFLLDSVRVLGTATHPRWLKLSCGRADVKFLLQSNKAHIQHSWNGKTGICAASDKMICIRKRFVAAGFTSAEFESYRGTKMVCDNVVCNFINFNAITDVSFIQYVTYLYISC